MYWVTAWILITVSYNPSNVQYSPDVKTLRDCEIMREALAKEARRAVCVEVQVQRKVL